MTSGAARAEEACAPWQGEYAPLPRVDDRDPFAAAWARLRAGELARRAGALEAVAPIEANRLWQRVLCLDPNGQRSLDGFDRTRPHVVVLGVSALAPGLLKAPAQDFTRFDAALSQAEWLIEQARFADALEAVRALRLQLDALDPSPGGRERGIRLEVLAATALVAFGDEDAAQVNLQRVLRADPNFDFDEDSTSPKLRRALEAARGTLLSHTATSGPPGATP